MRRNQTKKAEDDVISDTEVRKRKFNELLLKIRTKISWFVLNMQIVLKKCYAMIQNEFNIFLPQTPVVLH